MWVRKTERELDHDETRRKSLWAPACEALLIALFISTSYALGFRGYLALYPPAARLPFSEAKVAIPLVALILFPFVFPLSVFMRRTGGWNRLEHGDPKICVGCQDVQKDDACCVRCGAKLEPLHHWKWSDVDGA
jgi:hypothetical protein